MVEFTNQLSSDQYFSLSWDSQNTYFTCGQASAIRNELISLSLTGVPILPSYISTSNLWENVVSKSSSSVIQHEFSKPVWKLLEEIYVYVYSLHTESSGNNEL